jgi:hypothetical protein
VDADAAAIGAALSMATTGSVFDGGASTWTQSTGQLTMTVNMPNAHWLANEPASFSFTLQNSASDQVKNLLRHIECTPSLSFKDACGIF